LETREHRLRAASTHIHKRGRVRGEPSKLGSPREVTQGTPNGSALPPFNAAALAEPILSPAESPVKVRVAFARLTPITSHAYTPKHKTLDHRDVYPLDHRACLLNLT